MSLTILNGRYLKSINVIDNNFFRLNFKMIGKIQIFKACNQRQPDLKI